jgi:hypothetical protein
MSARRGDGALGTIVNPAFRRPNPSQCGIVRAS